LFDFSSNFSFIERIAKIENIKIRVTGIKKEEKPPFSKYSIGKIIRSIRKSSKINLSERTPMIPKIKTTSNLLDSIEIEEERKLKDMPSIKVTVNMIKIRTTNERLNPDIGIETNTPNVKGIIE
jgi:hypothetical protein